MEYTKRKSFDDAVFFRPRENRKIQLKEKSRSSSLPNLYKFNLFNQVKRNSFKLDDKTKPETESIQEDAVNKSTKKSRKPLRRSKSTAFSCISSSSSGNGTVPEGGNIKVKKTKPQSARILQRKQTVPYLDVSDRQMDDQDWLVTISEVAAANAAPSPRKTISSRRESVKRSDILSKSAHFYRRSITSNSVGIRPMSAISTPTSASPANSKTPPYEFVSRQLSFTATTDKESSCQTRTKKEKKKKDTRRAVKSKKERYFLYDPVHIFTRQTPERIPESDGVTKCRELHKRLSEKGLQLRLNVLLRALLQPMEYRQEIYENNQNSLPKTSCFGLLSHPMHWLPKEYARVQTAQRLAEQANDHFISQWIVAGDDSEVDSEEEKSKHDQQYQSLQNSYYGAFARKEASFTRLNSFRSLQSNGTLLNNSAKFRQSSLSGSAKLLSRQSARNDTDDGSLSQSKAMDYAIHEEELLCM